MKNIFELELAECINEAFNMSLEDVVKQVSEMASCSLQQSKIESLANNFLYACITVHTSKETSYTYKEALKIAEFFYKKLRKYKGLH